MNNKSPTGHAEKPRNTQPTAGKAGLFLIGTGMTSTSISIEALEKLKQADKIYLENYTVNFPYPKSDLENQYNIKIKELDRANVEDESILEEAKTQNIALLVYGDSLSATTHTQLVLECKKQNIKCNVYHNASIMTSVAETGLSLYKFGKTTSMPNWQEHTNKPTSFAIYIKQNQSIQAHTLILTDIGLEITPAIRQLKESAEKEELELPEKIIAISHAGTSNQKIFYDTPGNLSDQKVGMPFCLIIPNNLSHIEQETLENLKN